MPPGWVTKALEAFPALGLESADLQSHVEARVEDPDALEPERLAELALCFACTLAKPRALAIFEARFIARVPEFVRRIDSGAAFAQEVQQILRERLLAGPEPKLMTFAGRGSLEGWVRVSATRAALELCRQRKRLSREETAPAQVLLDDPELDHIKRRYSAEFGAAFKQALEGLGDRDRTVLSLYLLDGLNIDRIGRLFEVHRATVARWLSGAREQLYQDTHEHLARELALSDTEFQSIARLVQSQLDVSVRRILRENREAG